MAKVNVEVQKNNNENNQGLLRRFSRRVHESGAVKTLRKKRFFTRSLSDYKAKKEALRKITKKVYYDRLKKLGKIS